MPLPRKRPAYYFINASTMEQAAQIGDTFVKRHRDFSVCRVNAERIIRYMRANNLAVSLENLDRAYAALKAEGQLKLKQSIGGESGEAAKPV